MKRIKVIHMVTVAKSLELMKGQLKYLEENGFNLTIISSPGEELDKTEVNRRIPINMEREINLVKDIKSLIKLIYVIQREKPVILNTGTPKAGLLGIIAAYITRVPHRIYTLRGLRLETTYGVKGKILWLTEKIACTLATKVICISPSLKDEAIKLGLLKKTKAIILGNGSSNGVAIQDYPNPNKVKGIIAPLKGKININNEDFVIGYVGRIVKDKGINELIKAFKALEKMNIKIKLLILGSFENGDPVKPETRYEIENNENIIHVGYIENPSMYYYMMDVFVFPTYREGFGNVSIQAQAAQIPVITTDVTGAVDTIINGTTGLIISKGSIEEIINKITYFIENEDIKKEMGKNGRDMVIEKYDSKIIWNELVKFYNTLLGKNDNKLN